MPSGCGESGEMPEWSIGAVSKTVVRATGPRVRIPLSPQRLNESRHRRDHFFTEDPKGSFNRCRIPRNGITEGNPIPGAVS